MYNSQRKAIMKREEILTEFMDALKRGELPAMSLVTKTWKSAHEQKDMKALTDLKVKEWKLVRVERASGLLYRCIVSVRHKFGGNKIQLMMIKERGVRKSSMMGDWGVNPISWRRIV